MSHGTDHETALLMALGTLATEPAPVRHEILFTDELSPLRPSMFSKFPSSSVTGNHESEQIATNIMRILKRTGDTFRPLDWEEYKVERLKDGHFTERERGYFDAVIDHCASAETAKLFSASWKNALSDFINKGK